jgi:hypothetical protein
MSATQNALAGLQQLDLKHRHAPLEPVHSKGVADALVKRLETIRQPVPVAVQRFQDRATSQRDITGCMTNWHVIYTAPPIIGV